MKRCTLTGILLAVLLAGSPPAVSAEAFTPDAPVLVLHARADKPECVQGEPVRFIVSIINRSPDSLIVYEKAVGANSYSLFYTVTAPQGQVMYRTGPDRHRVRIGPEVLAPLDSVVYVVHVNDAYCAVDADGRSVGHFQWGSLYSQAGEHRVRVVCRVVSGGISEMCNVWDREGQVLCSNEFIQRVRRATRNEQRVLGALVRAAGVSMLEPSWIQERVRMLVDAGERIPENSLWPYLGYTAARSSLGEYLDNLPARRSEVLDAIEWLEDVREEYPAFRPDEVGYWLSLARLRLVLASPRDREMLLAARDGMAALMNSHPELAASAEHSRFLERSRVTGNEVVVRLRTERNCVIGQPMLFRVSIVNVSSITVRVPPPTWWDPYDPDFCARFEIENPDGTRELRTSGVRWSESGGARSTIPLAPGDSVTFDLTTPDRILDAYDLRDAFELPFRAPGRYRVRVGFEVSNREWRVWGAGRLTLSRPVEISLREPDEREARILAALESFRRPSEMPLWPNNAEPIGALRKMLAEDSDPSLAFHAERTLAYVESRDPLSSKPSKTEIVSRLEQLEKIAPDLWRDEVRIDLLRFLRFNPALAGEVGERVIRDMQRSNPSVWADHRFYNLALQVRYPGRHGTRCWEQRLGMLGVKPPTRSELDALMDATAP